MRVQFTGQDLGRKGIVNRGDRETTVRDKRGKAIATVPAGHGLLSTIIGPQVVAPGEWIEFDEDGWPSVCLSPAEDRALTQMVGDALGAGLELSPFTAEALKRVCPPVE